MAGILDGVRVVELASWAFVPSAGAVLADWGADVLKIEHPERPDPQRALVAGGVAAGGGRSFMAEQANRGKRSIGLDVNRQGGRSLLYRLVETADVFLTSWLPEPRRRLEVDVAHLRARNPDLVYARGSGHGSSGPDAGKAGFDGTAYVARASFGHALRSPEDDSPVGGTPAVGDYASGIALAGGIAGALFHRERTGVASVVDVSLLGMGMWQMAPGIVATGMLDMPDWPRRSRHEVENALTLQYRSSDGRYIKLSLLDSDRYWLDLCASLGRADLAADGRFASHAARAEHHVALMEELDRTFASHTLDELKAMLGPGESPWAVVQTPRELHDDPQAIANGYLPVVTTPEGSSYAVVASPMQFDEARPTLRPAPQHGEHTDEVLLELGLSSEELIEHKVAGDVL